MTGEDVMNEEREKGKKGKREKNESILACPDRMESVMLTADRLACMLHPFTPGRTTSTFNRHRHPSATSHALLPAACVLHCVQ